MRLTHWLAGLARKQPLSRRSIRRKWHGDLRPAVERLEDRTLRAAPHPFDLSTLDGSNGFRLDGIDSFDYSGRSLSVAGDVNGDGYADILVGAYRAWAVVSARWLLTGARSFEVRTSSTAQCGLPDIDALPEMKRCG